MPDRIAQHLSERADAPLIQRKPVLSPTYDRIVVEASLQLLNWLRADGFPPAFVSTFVAEHIADEVALHGKAA